MVGLYSKKYRVVNPYILIRYFFVSTEIVKSDFFFKVNISENKIARQDSFIFSLGEEVSCVIIFKICRLVIAILASNAVY